MASEEGAAPGPVLFVTRKWAPATGGMETWSQRLSEELSRLTPVEVIALPGRSGGRPPSALALLLFPFTILARYLSLPTPPACLHIGDMALWPVGLLRLFNPRMAVVISAHGTDVSYPRRGGLRGWLYGVYLREGAALLGNARVIANSQATLHAARENGWHDVRVVALATDLAPSAPARSHTRDILFAGRLIEQKGCGWFVREVLPRLPEQIGLKVAGTPWHRSEDFVLDHPRVTHLGNLPHRDLAREYGRALCVVIPNLELENGEFEGFGLVACEAAACGGIVLAARTGGLVEAVVEGETGFLLPPGDADAWTEAIERVAGWSEERRAQFTAGAASSARERFNWPRVARETLAAYPARAVGRETSEAHG